MCMGTRVSMGDKKKSLWHVTVGEERDGENLTLPAFRQVSVRSDDQFSKKLGSQSSVLLPQEHLLTG